MSQEGRSRFMNELTPLIDDLTGMYNIADRNKLQEMKAQKKHKEDVQMQALMNVMQSGKGVAENYSTIINELNKTIQKLSNE